MKVLLWYHRHHSPAVDEADSLDDALGRAFWMVEDNHGSPDSIEVVNDDGTRFIYLEGQIKEMNAERYRKAWQTATESPRPAVELDLRTVEGHWAHFQAYTDPEAAERDRNDFAQAIGAERVRLVELDSHGARPIGTPMR